MSPHSRAPGAVTSAIAGERAHRSGLAAAHAALVVEAVRRHPGLSSLALAGHCPGLDRYQVARRLPEAAAAGLVHSRPPESLEPGSRPAYTWWPGRAPEPVSSPPPPMRCDGQVVLL